MPDEIIGRSPSSNQKRVKKTPRTLLVAYGNPDREDDGVAYHVLTNIAQKMKREIPEGPEIGFFPEGKPIDFWFNLQLMPEMAEEMAAYDRICFIDAHTGAVENEIHWQIVEPIYQSSPLTHHMTPQSIVSILNFLYQKRPEAVLVSIRGYQFGFQRSLSPKTEALCHQAANRIYDWLKPSL